MDSYDLFGEDVTGSVLAGLDLGSNNYDPSAASRGGGEYQQQQQQAPSSQQQQQQQQHAYPAGDAGAAAAIQKQQSAYMQQHPSMQKQPYPHMPQDSLQKQSAAYPHLQPQQAQSQQQESPLQKLASFGGDFPASSNHMDPSSQAMYHQNHSGYGDTTRPIHPSSAASSMSGGYVRSIAPQAQATGQYGYGGMDNMYSMDQSMGMSDSSSMQGWNSSANYRQQAQHYSQMSQGGYRQPHMGYQDPSTMGSQTKLPPQQYPNQQGMMGSMMQSHQSIPPTSSYSLAQQQQRMPLHQASQQQPSQQQPPGPQQQQYHAQNSQSMSYPSGNAGYGSYGPMHQAGSRMPPHVQYPGSQSQMQMPDMSSGQSQSYSQGFGGFGQPQPTPQQPSQQAPSQPQQAPPQQQIQTPAQAQPQQPQASQPPPHQQPASQSQQPGQQPTQQALIRPIGVDVGPSSQYPSSQKGPQSGIGGASPQYRAPFPQLSPQMSPRAQQPQQMSPRPVMSPAKPSTLSPHPHATLSPRPKSATPTPQASFPSQQSTLQALEQMVMPQVPAGSDYPGYGPRSQMGQPQSSPLGPRTPVSPQWPQQGGNRSAFSMNGSMGMVDSQSAATSQPSSGPTDTTGASAPQPEYSPAPGTPASAGEKEGTKTSTLSELNGPQSQPTVDPNSTAAGSGPDSSSMLSHGNMNASYPSSYSSYMGANSMPYGSKPGEMLSGGHVYAGLPHSAPSVPTSMEGMHSSMYGAQPPPQGPGHGPVGPVASGHGQSMSMMGGEWGPGPGPGQGPPAMSHQQEMAALQQQIQELYCMPPGPEHQKIPQLQSRLSLLQRHEMTDRCSGGPQCMLSQQQGYGYGGMEAPGPYQQPAPTGRGKGRAKSTTPRAKKPRSKKAQQELLMQQQMEAEAAAAAAARAANYNMGPVPGVGHGHGPDMGSPPYHPGMGGHMQPPPHMAGMPPPAPPHQQHQQHQPHLPPHLAGHMPGPGHMPHHMAGPGPGPGPGPDSASGPPPPMGPGPGPGPGSGPGQARMGGMLPPHLGGPVGPGGPGPGPGGVPSSQAGPMMGMGPVPAPGPPPSLLQGPPPPQQPPPLPMQPLPSPVAAAPPQSAPSLQPSAPPRAPSLPPQMPLEASAQPPIQPSTLPPLLTPEVPLKSEPMPPSLGGPQGPPMPSGPQLSQLPQAPQLDTSIQSPSFDHNTAEMARKVETSTPVAEIKPENINEQPLSQEQSQSAETYQPVPSPGLGLQSPIPQPEPKLEMPAPGGMPLAQEYPHLPQQPVLEPGEIPMYPMGGMQYPGQMMDGQMAELDADGKLKGGRKPRSRKPKEPKEPKEAKTPKAPKEKTVKEPKAPKEPKLLKEPKAPRERKERKTRDDKGRRRTPKKRRGEGEDVEPDESQEAQEGQDPSMADEEDTPPAGGDDETIESAPATDGDTTLDSTAESSPLKSKSRNRKSKGVVASKVRKSGSSSSRRKKRKKEYEKDDDEVDDVLLATPPASPEEDAEGSVLKRRSARNTHRKKYVDDDMLRFSDDEEKNSKPAEPKQKTESAVTKVEKVETPEQVPVKPNYVYINPGDEDTMVVQHILAVRKGRRELKKDPEPAIENEAEKEPPGTAEEKPDSSDTNVDAEKESQDSETCDNAVDKPKGNDATEEGDGSGAGDVTKGDSASNDEKVLKAETDSSEKDQPVNESSKEETDDNVKDDKMDVDTPAEEQGSVETSRSEDQKTEVKTEVKKEDKSDEKEDEEDEKEEAKQKPAEPKKTEDKDEEKEWVEVDEFYVKYRNFSYLHCEWKTEEELLKGDKRVQGKIKRFLQKQAHLTNIFENLEEDPFNPDYVEVDRVLDVSEQPDPNTGNSVKHYLVKWRALQYEDSTWELEEDIDPLRIQEFERFRKLPPRDQWRPKKRPSAEEWRRLPVSPVFKNGNTLREYQLEGLNWLMFSWYNGRNCILADEMGLGKTIQSLTFVHSVYKYGIRGPFLVIAPLSTIPNWQREFEAWTDLNVVVYHGSGASRNMLMEYELYFRNDKGQTIRDLAKFNVLITTFEMIITDVAELKTFNWRLCVIDEAHRLKNRNCKLLEGLRSLKLEHRVLLSGTPLQNNVNELFSLLNFLEPSQFTSSEAFLQEFGALKSDTEVNKLQSVLKPMMLRRLKEDVEKSIAPKEETVVEVELTNIQKKYYRGILERNFSFLSKGTTSNNVPNLMNTMMELRKCCIHPYLLNGAEDQIQYDYKIAHGEDPDAYYKALINSSGKMVLIDKLLPKLKSNGHRVLIFSQMVRCLDILEDYLMYQKYQFERIDGRIRGNLRQAAIDRFCKPDSDRFVFLLCTKAGGQGINLTAADTVIIFDSDWNPQNDLQAQARCHRIGQQKMVKVYRLLCRNTYEREMFDKASLKLGLDKAILQSMNTSQSKDAGGKQQLTKKEIEDLLKKGAYGAIMDEDNAGDKFCEEDIDQILERRTQIITLESEKGSTFSKASFACSTARQDIDVDDPDFWKKWAKKAEIDTTEKCEEDNLVISEPRRRTQIKRYGHDESTLNMSELESSNSDSEDEGEEDGSGRRGRKRDKKRDKKRRPEDHVPREGEIAYGSWDRSECFKVERGLLTFGWARWKECLASTQFRKGWTENAYEDCARVILLYCLRFYRGDEKIRSFIWDLITPAENGQTEVVIHKNHSGLNSPVPRGGRKPKKSKSKEGRSFGQNNVDKDHWSNAEKYDGDFYLEPTYKKHLLRHANKVLLRVRMLYYIKHEVLQDVLAQIAENVPASTLPVHPPPCDLLPVPWWDSDADRSLLIGTYKHGYENYTAMRNDPALGFLARVGPMDPNSAVLGDSNSMRDEDKLSDEDEEGGDRRSRLKGILKTPEDVDDQKDANGSEEASNTGKSDDGESKPSSAAPLSPSSESPANDDTKSQTSKELEWPSAVDLNTRLRRVITAYQRNFKKQELAQMQKAKQRGVEGEQHAVLRDALNTQGVDFQQLAMYLWKMERREKIEQIVRERERQRLDCSQKKWSRREEADFLRAISMYGVETDRKTGQLDWTKFRSMAHLEKKYDDTMTEYYRAFCAMLKRTCGKKLTPDEEMSDMSVESLSEERARKLLERLELLSKIREDVLHHPKLDDRLRLCRTSADMPEWWIPGRHDKDLLLGVAKHGLVRTDHYILNDPDLSFQKIIRKLLVGESLSSPSKVKKELEPESKNSSGGMKLERPEDILRMDKGEILVKLEKGEGTLRIEKLGLKSEVDVSIKSEKDDIKPSVKKEPEEASDKAKPSSEREASESKQEDSINEETQSKEEASDKTAKETDANKDETGEEGKPKEGGEVCEESPVEEKKPSDTSNEDPADKKEPSPTDEKEKEKKVDDEEMEVEPMKEKEKEVPETEGTADIESIPKESKEIEGVEKAVPTDEKLTLDPDVKEGAEETPKAEKTEVQDEEMPDAEKEPKTNEEKESGGEKVDKEDSSEDKPEKPSEDVDKSANSEEPSLEKKDEPPQDNLPKESEVVDEKKEETCVDVAEKEAEKEPQDEGSKTVEEVQSVEEGKADKSSKNEDEEATDNKTKDKSNSSPDNADVKIEKEIRGKVQSELQALYPDIEVVHPLSRLPEIDTIVIDPPKGITSQHSQGQHFNQRPSFGSQSPFNQQAFAQLQQSLQGMNSAQALQQLQSMEKLDPSVSQLLAQSFQSQIKWPKDIAIETRLQHIVHCVEKGEWPVSRNFSVFQSSVPQLPVVLPPGVTATIPNNHSNSNIDVDLAYIETVNNDRRDGASTPYSDSSDIITITTDNGSLSSQYPQFMRKRKRHIAIDVETERAKLHALLNSTNSNQHQSSHLGYRTDRDRYDRQDRNDRSYDRAYDRQQQQQHQHQLERQQRQMKEYERHHLMERQQQLERAAQLMEKVDRRQPTPQPKQSPLSWDDDSPSDDSRRSTPAHQPPPAHQQGPRVISMPYDLGKFTVPSKPKPAPQPAASPAPSPSSSSGAIDLSGGPPKSKTPSEDSYGAAGEDEAQDFSMGRKRKSSKLDDMLGKLMQKKNVPVPADEPVVGKEMKRRKLDEIVMGLSAAKEQQYPDPMLKRRSPAPMIPPGVTVTPASSSSRTPTPTHSSSGSSSKPPFSITVTSVQPPHSQSSSGSSRTASNSNASSSSNLAKDAYSSYLAQAEQHNLLLKQHQLQQQILQQQKLLQTTTSSSTQRKTYEAMLADINKAAELTSKLNSYSQSQDAKVNKWLSEQAALLPEAAGLGADFLPRRRRPRVDPTLLDWKKLTGEENVSVINRLTQKKLTGNKAPPLKHLAQWLLENPMFDVDPKWAELVKERGNLPHDLQKRLPGGERKKPGRPPILPSPSSQSTSSSSASQVASQAMNFQGLGSLNPSLLSSMAQNNPFLLPFAGLPNMNAAALGSMSGLGNLSNLGLSSSLFANLASLGLPGLSGMDAAALTELLASAGTTATPTASSSSSSKKTDSMHSSSHGQDRDKDRDRRDDRDRSRDQDRGRDRDRDRGSSGVSSSGSTSTSNSKSASASASASAAAAAANSLAYLFPNPNLLYSPLGMSGLSPFSYESLAQQVGLLNGSLASTASTPTSSRSTSSASAAKTQSSSSRMSTPISSASSVAANNRHQREALERQHQQLQQFLLPQDTKLLESLSKSRLGSSSTSASDASRSDDRARRSKAEADNLRHLMAGIPAAYSASDPSGKRSREQLERDTLNRLYDSMTESMLRSSSSSDHRVRDSLASVTSVGHTSQSHSSSRGSSSSDPYAKSREVLMKEAMDKYGHVPTDLIIRSSLSSDRGSDRGSERSSERTSSSSTSDSSKRPRDQVVKEALESLGQSLASGALAKQSREAIQMASLLGSPSWDLVMRGAGSSSDKRKVDAAALAAMELLSPAKSEGRSSGSREERVEKEDRGKDLRSRREDERSWAEDKSRRSQDDRDKSKARPMDVQDLSTDLSITTVSSKSSKETGAAPAEPSDVAASGSDITSERPAKRAREPDDAATAAALDMASKRVREDKPEESEPEVRPEARASPAPARPEVAAAEPDAVAMSVTSDDHDAGADAADATGDTGDAKASDEPQDAPSGSGPSGQEEGDAEEQSKSARGQRRRAKSKVEEEAPVVERKVLRSSAGRAAAAAAARAAREQAEQAAASARSREESESYEA